MRTFVFIMFCLVGLSGCSNTNHGERQVLADWEDEKAVEEMPPQHYEEKAEVLQSTETISKKTESPVDTDVPNSDQDWIPITWADFFDDETQSSPSKQFWELKGENVEIKGWMGEVLDIGNGWFLLLPAPGADCPFCSEDESYWNEILMVFAEDKKKLRYTNEPLLVRGTLDVGIKIDESNYKTMFRLYSATVEGL